MHLQENGYTRGGYPGFPKLRGKKGKDFSVNGSWRMTLLGRRDHGQIY